MGLVDIFGKGSNYFSNKERMRKIRQSGKDGEEQFRRDKFLSNIERKHHGKDFVEKETDWIGKTRKIPWEVKRNNSPLSPKQKRTRNLHVRRYVDTPYGVEARTEDKHGNRLEHNVFSGKWEKVKNQSNQIFGNNTSLNSKSTRTKSKRKKTTKPPSSDFSSLFLGTNSSSKKTKTRKKKSNSTNFDSLFWGSKQSSGRKTRLVW